MLARNPWGYSTYNGDWKHDDPKWTTEYKSLVPYGLGDDVTSNLNGLFVIPVEKLKNSQCFDGIDITLDIPGYSTSRYDWEDAPILCSNM